VFDFKIVPGTGQTRVKGQDKNIIEHKICSIT
jgi:hypothetical protein